jgi:hypothetical protein
MTRSSGRTGSRSKPHPLLSNKGCSASAWTLSAANITTGIADAHDLAQQSVLSGDGDRVVYRYASDRSDVLEEAETLVFVDFLGIRLPVLGAGSAGKARMAEAEIISAACRWPTAMGIYLSSGWPRSCRYLR